MALENDYEVLERLGEGAFGKVYKARHRRSDDVCAVKQIKLGAKSWDEALRSTELQALKALRHPFIVRLRELIRSSLDGSLYYIFEFIGSDLFRLMRQYPHGLEEPRAVELTRQLFAGVAHIHQYNFFHRDIKPENILFDAVHETVRIADFGEARSLRARPPFTDYVGTRWYRAPECLLRDRAYSSPVDIWASGLVFAELLRGSAVFCGTSSIDQLYKIFQVLGAPPTMNDWPDFKRLAEACRVRVPDGKGCGLHRVLPRASKQAQAFLTEILTLNPRRRPLARKVLEHSLFGQCLALDMDRLDTCRSAASGATGTPTEERFDTHRSSVPATASSAAPSPEEAEEPAAAPGLPRTPPGTGGPLSVRSELRADGDGTPRTSVTTAAGPADDLDLDAELDKILGGTSLAATASRPPMPTPLGAEAQESLPADAPLAPPLAGDAATRSTSAGSFKFTPSLRDGSRGREARGHDEGAARGSQERLASPLAVSVDAPPGPPHAAASQSHPESPASPIGRDVDALLDSLCADLGVDGAAGAPAGAGGGAGGGPGGPPAEPGADGAGAGAREATGGAAGAGGGPEPWAAPPPGPPEPGPRAEPAPEGEGAGAREAAGAGAAWGGPRADLGVDGEGTGVRETASTAGVTTTRSSSPSREPLHQAPAEAGGALAEELEGEASDAGAAEAGPRRAASRHPPWSAEEASQLRRAVKRVIRRGIREKEVLWAEVSRELGGARGPRECKSQYTRDYKTHKASVADLATEPPQKRPEGSTSRSPGRVNSGVEPGLAAAAD